MNSADLARIERLCLLGCGKMGSAMLAGWLAGGLPAGRVSVVEPAPSDWLQARKVDGLALNPDDLGAPTVAVIAVKPQLMAEALPRLASLAGQGTLFISIAAGTPIALFEDAFGAAAPIIRAMPNTPAAVGRGITALIGNGAATPAHLKMAEDLMAAVGDVVRLTDEDEMHAVTALSGSGPAYVFHLIEAMAEAGTAAGLSPDLAAKLARATVTGAGALASEASETPKQLRVNVTSPGGTTAAGLSVLMPELPALLSRAVAAAADRSRELAQ